MGVRPVTDRNRANGCCAFCGRDLDDCHCDARRAAGPATRKRLDARFRALSRPTEQDLRDAAFAEAEAEADAVREAAAARVDAEAWRCQRIGADALAAFEAIAGPEVAASALEAAMSGSSMTEIAHLVLSMREAAQVAETPAEAAPLPTRRGRKAAERRARWAPVLTVARAAASWVRHVAAPAVRTWADAQADAVRDAAWELVRCVTEEIEAQGALTGARHPAGRPSRTVAASPPHPRSMARQRHLPRHIRSCGRRSDWRRPRFAAHSAR